MSSTLKRRSPVRLSALPTLALTVALTVGALAGCSRSGEATSQGDADARPVLISTVPMLGDLVAAVAGDAYDARTLLGRGVDPHVYKPTTSDIIACREAAAVFYVGLRLEGALADDLSKLGQKQPHVVAVGPTLPTDRLIPLGEAADDGEHTTGEFDPHIWMDVSLWAETVPAIVDTLSQLDPDRAATFEANAAALQDRLAKLHQYVGERIETIPEGRRIMISSHDAFQYFGAAYDLDVRGVQGISTASEAGIRDIENLLALIRESGVTTIFTETSTSNKQVEAVVEAAQSEGLQLQKVGDLFSDSTGPAGTYEGTYEGMVDHNVTMLVTALGGDVPEGGFRSLRDK